MVVLQKRKVSASQLASSPMPSILQFERQDWSLFRTVEGLQQRAGVPKKKLRRLVLKELADNGLDESAKVRVGSLDGGGYYVEDDGPGIDRFPAGGGQFAASYGSPPSRPWSGSKLRSKNTVGRGSASVSSAAFPLGQNRVARREIRTGTLGHCRPTREVPVPQQLPLGHPKCRSTILLT